MDPLWEMPDWDTDEEPRLAKGWNKEKMEEKEKKEKKEMKVSDR